MKKLCINLKKIYKIFGTIIFSLTVVLKLKYIFIVNVTICSENAYSCCIFVKINL